MEQTNTFHKRLCLFALIAAPPIILLVFIKLFGVNVAYADDWAFVPLIEKMFSGKLSFGDLFRGHNEHRILFPRIIMLFVAHFMRYNTVAIMYCSWALVALTFVMILDMYRLDFGSSASALLKFAPVAWLLFSLRQYESILWAFEIQIYLCVTGSVAAIYLLQKTNRYLFPGAVCSGIVATFSFANGLLVWPAGLAFLIMSKTKDKMAYIYLWILAGVAVSILYLYDLTAMSGKTDMFFALKNPVAALMFLVLNIGSPLAFMKSSAIGMGAAAGVFIIAILYLTVRKGVPENAKWITLILLSLSFSLFFTAGRLHFGLWAALASRYVPFTIIGIVGIYMAVLNYYEKAADADRKHRYAMLYGAIVSMVLIGVVSGYASGTVRGREISESRKRVAGYLMRFEQASDDDLEPILFDVDKVRERAKILERHRFNVFQDRPR